MKPESSLENSQSSKQQSNRPSKLWTADDLKRQLTARREVLGWAFRRQKVRRRERYFLSDHGAWAIDQDRDTTSLEQSLELFVRSSRAGYQGELKVQLYSALPLEEQLESAIAAASLTEQKSWNLPAPSSEATPEYLSCDPRVIENIESCVTQLSSQMREAALKPRPSQFNSAELFVSLHEDETEMSTGITYKNVQSRFYIEAAFSKGFVSPAGSAESNEYLGTRFSVNLEDLEVAKFFDRCAESAEASTHVVAPKSGHYAVLIDEESLLTIIDEYSEQLHAASQYNSLPHRKAGQDFIEGAVGDALELSLDPSLAYGAGTRAVAGGLPQKPLVLVHKNKVAAQICDKRHADYMGQAATTVCGNWVLAKGTTPVAELRRAAPQVLQVLQFSSLNVDGFSGTFSSEIRLAKLYDNQTGQTSYIKGGSLSASIGENFKKLRLSREGAKRSYFSYGGREQGYEGPAYALLNDVSIVG